MKVLHKKSEKICNANFECHLGGLVEPKIVLNKSMLNHITYLSHHNNNFGLLHYQMDKN